LTVWAITGSVIASISLVAASPPQDRVLDRRRRRPAGLADGLAVGGERSALGGDDHAQVLHLQLAGGAEERVVVLLREPHDLAQRRRRRPVGEERRLALPVDLALREGGELRQRLLVGGLGVVRLDRDGAGIGRGDGRRDRRARQHRGDGGVAGRALQRQQPRGRRRWRRGLLRLRFRGGSVGLVLSVGASHRLDRPYGNPRGRWDSL
jgi:hypothetical protein